MWRVVKPATEGAKSKFSNGKIDLFRADFLLHALIWLVGIKRLAFKIQCKSSTRVSVYDLDKDKDGVFDAVYFSGSFTLLPDPVEALRVVKPLTKSKIYVTQTYQRKSPPLLGYIKPLLKYLTTIDFGQLTYEAEIAEFFSEKVPKECSLKLESHEVIKGSLDTSLQAAYLTILDASS